MKRYVVLGITASLVSTAVVQAQGGGGTISPKCAAGAAQDACQKAIDVFQYMAPQLGALITGGNATLGQGGTLGGFGRILIDVRGNLMEGSVPQVDKATPPITDAGAQQSNYPVKGQIIGLPQVDAAVGLFKGFPVGVTNVGGLDLLVSAEYLPSFSSGDLNVSVPNGSLKLGLGARVGIMQESILFPGIAVTYFRRSLPTADLAATTPEGDSLNINGMNLTTTAWRVVASKTLLLFGLAAGVGRDTYSTSTAIRGYAESADIGTEDIFVNQNVSRTNGFLDLTINLSIVKIIGEIGRVSGGTIDTYNTFSGHHADDALTYGSVGLRLGL